MEPSHAGDLGELQPGSDLPPDATSVPESAVPGEAVDALTVQPSSARREIERQTWPEWARAGKSSLRGLEPRQAAAGAAVAVSQILIAWSPWRRRSPSPGANTQLGAATVVAIAGCTSVFVTLATMWLWGSTSAPVPRSDAAPMVSVSLEPPGPAPTPTPDPVPLQPIARPEAPALLIRAVKPEPQARSSISTAPRAKPVAPRPRTAGTASSNLVVTSEPAGANVTINGVGYGPTPVTIRFLPPGAKRIRATKAGYQSQEHIVGAGAVASTPSVRLVLAELPGARGSQ